ncbi:hypothetical protein XENTR_v10017688 [Xenopus tropicalis]|nr:hypothetical protein XENTR_v10017688 [Xenopus tropicalis]
MLIITAVMVFDRYFTEAVMPLIEEEYGIDIKKTALVDGLFALGFTILAISPVFRYFGDWLSQKTIMCIGMTVWTLLTFTFCFVPKQWFWLILLLRGLLDIIADIFLSCALPLIGHMFSVSNRRLAIFRFQLCSFLFSVYCFLLLVLILLY